MLLKISRVYFEEHKLKKLPSEEMSQGWQGFEKAFADGFFDWVIVNKIFVAPSSQTGMI